MLLGEILVRFGAETSGLMRGIEIAKGGLASMAGIAVVAGVAIAGVLGFVAVKAAADFQQGLVRLKTGAGDVTDNLAKLGEGILHVSTDTGILTNGTNGLNAAMYLIISSGQRGAQSLTTLAAAAQGAQIEQAKVVDVAQVLTTIQKNFGLSAHTAAQYMDGLISAVAHGKITLEALSTAMSPILPMAGELGIHFADVAAAMSVMTNAGIPADQGATALRFTMQSMILPTKASQKAMTEWGLNSTKVAAEMKVSLPGAIQMYIDAAKRAGPEGSKAFIDALSQMMGGGQRAAKALFSLSQSMGDWHTQVGLINTAMGNMSKDVVGWADVQGNFNLQMDRGKAALNALAINIGTALLPVLTQIVQNIIPIITKFADWVVQSHAVENAIQFVQNAIKALTPFAQAMVGGFMAVMPMLVQVWQAFVDVVQRTSKWLAENKGFMEALKYVVIALGVALGVILLAALVLVVAAIAAVVLAVIIVVGIVNGAVQVVRAFGDVWNRTGAAIGVAIAWIVAQWNILRNAAVDVFNRTKQAIVDAFNATITWIKNAWNTAIAWIVAQWSTLANAAKDVWGRTGQAINTAVSAVVNWLTNIWNTCVHAIIGFFQWMYDHNYYWKQMVDTAVGTVKGGVALIVGAWNACVSFIVNLWNTLASAARDVWGRTGQAINTATTAVVNFVRNLWNTAVGWLKSQWDTVANAARDVWGRVGQAINTATTFVVNIIHTAWNAVVSFLSGVWNAIWGQVKTAWSNITGATNAGVSNVKAPITGFGSWASGFFGGLANTAVSWGTAIVQGLANGINGAVGAVISAAKNVAATVAKFLGFHSSVIGPAEEGPGRYLADWGPGIANGIANGMLQGLPQVRAAAMALLSPFGNIASLSQIPASGGPSATPATSSTPNEMITLLRSIDRKLDNGQPVSRYQLTQALGLLLADGVR